MMEVFFYGLFMDQDILRNSDIYPANPRKAYLNDYTLKIGDRASLVKCANEKAYGIVMTVGDHEITRLYAEKSVADYLPESVEVMTDTNEQVTATCYNLPLALLTGTNKEYAWALHKLAVKLDFPAAYLDRIAENFT